MLIHSKAENVKPEVCKVLCYNSKFINTTVLAGINIGLRLYQALFLLICTYSLIYSSKLCWGWYNYHAIFQMSKQGIEKLVILSKITRGSARLI